jgi:DNA end-binding protein Ku
MLTLAGHIVDSKAADFDPLTFRDRYEEALLAHLKAKQAGAEQERKPTFAAPRRVINLMEALLRPSLKPDTRSCGSTGNPQVRGCSGRKSRGLHGRRAG